MKDLYMFHLLATLYFRQYQCFCMFYYKTYYCIFDYFYLSDRCSTMYDMKIKWIKSDLMFTVMDHQSQAYLLHPRIITKLTEHIMYRDSPRAFKSTTDIWQWFFWSWIERLRHLLLLTWKCNTWWRSLVTFYSRLILSYRK